MNNKIRLLCLTAVIRCNGWVLGQEELPEVVSPPLVPDVDYPCGMGYTPSGSSMCLYDWPFGSSVHAALTAQVDNGIRANLTLCHYDFESGRSATQLSKHGLGRLHQLAFISMRTGFPVIVEADLSNPALNSARRHIVLQELRAIDPYFTDETVLVGTAVHGLRGYDANLIHQTELQNTQDRGPILGNPIGD